MSTEPFRGKKDLERATKEGRDINSDLEKKTEADESPTTAEAAVGMRISGVSYTNIAKTLGYSSAFRARSAVERALASIAESPEERDQQRVLASRRINRLLQSVMGRALDPKDPEHLAYNQQALRLVDREARLWGVDAPQQVAVHTASDEEIARLVAETIALGRAQQEAEEADIIDGEVVEDDEVEDGEVGA